MIMALIKDISVESFSSNCDASFIKLTVPVVQIYMQHPTEIPGMGSVNWRYVSSSRPLCDCYQIVHSAVSAGQLVGEQGASVVCEQKINK